MSEVISEIIPLALAVALSPFPVIPAILLLFTSRPRAAGFGFLAGWIAGITLGTVAFLLLTEIIEMADEPPGWASWTRIALGLLLVAVGLKKALFRKSDGQTPKWMSSIDALDPAGAARLGLILSLANPKVLLLAAAAGLAIGSQDLSSVGDIGAVLVFVLVASTTVALPVLFFVVRRPRVLEPLSRVRDWLERHNSAVMAVVLVVIGALLVIKGVSGI